jgi:hypothetical protein
MDDLLPDELFIGQLIRENLFGSQDEQPDDEAFPSRALILKLIHICLLILAIRCPEVLLLC